MRPFFSFSSCLFLSFHSPPVPPSPALPASPVNQIFQSANSSLSWIAKANLIKNQATSSCGDHPWCCQSVAADAAYCCTGNDTFIAEPVNDNQVVIPPFPSTSNSSSSRTTIIPFSVSTSTCKYAAIINKWQKKITNYRFGGLGWGYHSPSVWLQRSSSLCEVEHSGQIPQKLKKSIHRRALIALRKYLGSKSMNYLWSGICQRKCMRNRFGISIFQIRESRGTLLVNFERVGSDTSSPSFKFMSHC